MAKKRPEIVENAEGAQDAAQEPEAQDLTITLQADNLRLSGEVATLKERVDKLAHVVLQNWGRVI